MLFSLQLIFLNIFVLDQGSGFCVTGKIEAGYVQVGERLLVMPPNETCTVKGTVYGLKVFFALDYTTESFRNW